MIAEKIIEKIKLIGRVEKRKMEKKGLISNIVGYLLLFTMIYVSREVGVRVWPEYVEDKALFFFVGALALHFMAETWTFLLMLPGYLNWFSYYEKYKINKTSTWPWERPDWKIMKRKMIYNLLINQMLIFPFFIGMSGVIGVKQRFDDFPSFWEILGQLWIIYLLDDLFFYWGHRTFHSFKALYKMHKIHHEYDKVFTFTTEYFHPLDYAVANVVSLSLFSCLELWG